MTKGPAAKATGPFLFMNGVCRSADVKKKMDK